jgi:hypothetical protein
MTEIDDDFLGDFSVFISGDGHRVTDAPWRLQAYDRAGPLTTSQIYVLAKRFGLEIASLAKLSKYLGHVLNPSENVHVIPASPSKAKQAAKSDVAYARRQLKEMRAKLSAMIDRLSSLTFEDHDDESPHSPQYAKMLIDLQDSLESVTQAEATLQSLDGPTSGLVKWEPLDRRELHDRRRNEVLAAIFQFWVDAGRKISFTTDPLTSKRGGELVSFAQAVCACLTDPPTEITAETIVKQIRQKNKLHRPTSE